MVGQQHQQMLLHTGAVPHGLVLGIESSCDDTGVAIMTPDGRILGQALATQADVHREWGGVVPTLAMEAHSAAIDATVDAALADAGISAADLAAVAVTVGPGLVMCLQVGVQKAREVAVQHQLPIVAVHHMEAHALMARAAAARLSSSGSSDTRPEFPFLALLVSGGHNLLLVVRGVGDYQILGSTVDDAVGEAFDKSARLLGLDASGAALERLAAEGDPDAIPFAVPMIRNPTCDFSYAGLKTAVRRAVEQRAPGPATDANRQARADIAASFQAVAVKHLEHRCRRSICWALETCPDIKCLVVSGGVACNSTVRAALQATTSAAGLQLVVPPPELCTDNGAMIAWAGQERLALGLACPPPTPDSVRDKDMLHTERGGWLRLRPRWPLTDERHPRAVHSKVYLGLKKKRIHPSLVELTAAALAGRPPGEEETDLQAGSNHAPGPALTDGAAQMARAAHAAAVI